MRILTVILILASGALAIARQPEVRALRAQSQMAPTGDLKDAADRVRKSTDLFAELVNGKDGGIPAQLLANAEAVVVIPTLIKGGFVAGAKHGKGIVSVRRSTMADGTSAGTTTGAQGADAWTGPAFVKMTGGSIGWQIGVESVDLVLLVMNRKGVDELIDDRFTVGGSLSIAAGPLG